MKNVEMKPEDVMRGLEHWAKNFDGKLTDFATLCSAHALLQKYRAENAKKDAEIEGLKANNKELDNLCDLLHQKLDEGYAKFANEERAEAINEFEERLKQASYANCTITGYRHYIVDVADIDKIAKELKEGKDAGAKD